MDLTQRKIFSLKQWKELAAKDEAPKDCLVLVSADIEETKQLDEDGNVFRFIISTENPDRDKDVIRVNGWHFENYNKNPVVLFGHNYRALPVAVGSQPSVEGAKVLSNADFAASRVDVFAETVRQYVKAKVLRASSVGFDPLKWMYNEERRGYDFVEHELLEWSIVPVPANAEALQLAKSLKLDFTPIKEWAIRAIDEWSEEKGVFVPRSILEKSAKVGDSDRVFVIFEKQQLDDLLAGKAKAIDGCPEGGNCPMNDGDASCPKGDSCPLGKGKSAQPTPLHSHSFTVGADDKATTETFTGKAEECPVCKRLAEKPKEKPAADPPPAGPKETGALVELELDEEESETREAEPVYDIDPEDLRQGIREVMAPLIMQRTGRVL